MGKSKKKSKKNKEHRRRSSSSSKSSSTEEWVEKESVVSNLSTSTKTEKESNKEREEWMSLPTLYATTSSNDRRKEREENKQKVKLSEQYDPRKSSRELNPYWKTGGDGLPSLNSKSKFKKPDDEGTSYSSYKSRSSRSNWRKSSDYSNRRQEQSSSSRYKNDKISERNDEKWSKNSTIIYTSEDHEDSSSDEKKIVKTDPITSEMITDKEMNDIAAKIIKAEILGDESKVKELKEKLERARKLQNDSSSQQNNEDVLLYRTDSKGYSRPLNAPQTEDNYKKRKNKKVETHSSGKRQKYYADDDKYDLKKMFESEKFNSNEQQDAEFLKLTRKASKVEDLDDVFVDKIRNENSSGKQDQKERDRAIREHNKMTESLDKCSRCLQSKEMDKHLMISLGETIYLSLPPHEPLTTGHCLLIPIRHASCSTQLDENEWSEILDFRKALTKMFLTENKDVIFYETVLNAHSYSHMVMHCIPIEKEQGDVAPIYFKKAIDECEGEWTTNKKLINLAGKDVRRAIPKGLPYFFVSFGMTEGFAHVIEDQRYFPQYFAAEIIGGILDLHHSKWRRQQNQKFDLQKERVLQFTNTWSKYDCTIKS